MRKHNISFDLPEDFDDLTDLYLPEDYPERGIIYPGAREVSNLPDYYDLANFLVEKAKIQKKLEFSLELIARDSENGEKIVFRGHSIKSAEGKFYIFRRLPSYIPDINDIGLRSGIVEILLHERLNRGGLVIIAGETGQGKSTTAAAAISYRLSHFGSFCLTIEDPIELPLQGFYPNLENPNKRGVCFQTNVDSDNSIFDMLKSSLRCYPSSSNSILYLGETRDAIMASEVLKIAANGHLVVTTMHGSDIITSLKRFISLASSIPNTNETEVRSLFSSVFRLLIHQKMEVAPNGNKRLRAEVLFSESPHSQVANRLNSNGNLDMLANEIHMQNQKLMGSGSLLYE